MRRFFAFFLIGILVTANTQSFAEESSFASPEQRKVTSTLQLRDKVRPLTTKEFMLLMKAARQLRENGHSKLSIELERVAGKLASM